MHAFIPILVVVLLAAVPDRSAPDPPITGRYSAGIYSVEIIRLTDGYRSEWRTATGALRWAGAIEPQPDGSLRETYTYWGDRPWDVWRTTWRRDADGRWADGSGWTLQRSETKP